MLNTYPVLNGEIVRRGIKKKVIADTLNISEKSFYNKLNGVSPFTWEEVRTMQTVFFPDMQKEDLLVRALPDVKPEDKQKLDEAG